MQKMWKCTKRDHDLPLRMRGSFFGLKTGSRGTPWNSKSAGPGGSEFTKCRFCPFIWHFGVFEGGSIFDTFLITFSRFQFLSFYHFFTFLILSLLMIFNFVDFWCFLSFHDFDVFHCFLRFWFIFKFLKGYLKDKALFWPLLPTIVHSHGKHFGGVISLCEKWALFFLEFLQKVTFFTHFWSNLSDFSDLPLRITFFWPYFDHFFHSVLMIFWVIFSHFWSKLVKNWPPLISVNKCPFGSQKVP